MSIMPDMKPRLAPAGRGPMANPSVGQKASQGRTGGPSIRKAQGIATRNTPPPLPVFVQAPPLPQAQTEALSPLQLAATAIVTLQSETIDARTRAELAYLAANEPRQLLRAQQIVVLERGRRNAFVVRAVSSVTIVDTSSPAMAWFESMVRELGRKHGLAKPCSIPSSAFGGGYQNYGNGYPLGHLLWVPWLDHEGNVIAGQLMLRMTPWTEAEAALGQHLAATFSHAWRALSKGSRLASPALGMTRRTRILASLTLFALLILPVPMTALAPVEVAPKDPAIVTSGIEGVVKAVFVEPNETVKKGQVLIRLADTALRNRFQISEREVAVAEMKYKKAAQLAVLDAKGRHELGVARTELGLKTAERNYAFELLARGEIKADRDGKAFFGDKKDLVGRPVAVGEKLMEIASPAQVEFRIDLGVSDAIVLNDHARVKVFLDSDPLNPITSHLVRAGYQAKVRDNQQLAYRLVAEAEPAAVSRLRLGVRGTAQVYGDLVPLGFYLFRRPIAAARQWLGL